MNGWEEPMKDMICSIREKELELSRNMVCSLFILNLFFIIFFLYHFLYLFFTTPIHFIALQLFLHYSSY